MTILYCVLIILSLLAAFFDFLFYKIPNIFVLGLLIFVVPFLYMTIHADQLVLTFSISAIILIISFALSMFGFIGAGDAKLLFATSLWAAPIDIVSFVLVMALAGGIISGIYIWGITQIDHFRLRLISWFSPILRKTKLFSVYVDQPFVFGQGETYRQTKIPYGIAIAFASTLLAMNQMGILE